MSALEEGALVGTPTHEEKSLRSIAISLKRIADVVGNPHALMDLQSSVQHIAWEAGRSFAAGQRTDR